MKLSPKVSLLLIAALFFIPLLLAWLMYAGAIDYRPGSTRNLGTLVQPPLPMSWADVVLVPEGRESTAAEAFAGHWVVLYRVPAECGQDCLAQVTGLRQVHRASGRQQSRIRIALLMPEERPAGIDDDLAALYRNFHLIGDPVGSLGRLLEGVSSDSRGYLIDPLGNIMMRYEDGFDPNYLKQDLKRLLTWSKLDEQ